MTSEAREASQNSPSGPAPQARVIVVGADDARMSQYRAALSTARLPFRALSDAAEAAALIADEPPEVLVLDLGLPRLAMLQLYGAARSAEPGESGEAVQVLFVGQDSDTGPDDHYLSGEPSPVMVASWVSDLLAGPEEVPALDMGVASALPIATGIPAGHDDRSGDTPAEADAGASQPVADADDGTEAPAGVAVEVPVAEAETGAASAVEPEPERPADVAETEPTPSSPPAPDTPAAQPVPVSPGVAAMTGTAEAAPDAAPSRRSYLTLVRIGLVLFILGLLLFLVRLEWTGPAIAPPPTVAPPGTPAGHAPSAPLVAFTASVPSA